MDGVLIYTVGELRPSDPRQCTGGDRVHSHPCVKKDTTNRYHPIYNRISKDKTIQRRKDEETDLSRPKITLTNKQTNETATVNYKDPSVQNFEVPTLYIRFLFWGPLSGHTTRSPRIQGPVRRKERGSQSEENTNKTYIISPKSQQESLFLSLFL